MRLTHLNRKWMQSFIRASLLLRVDDAPEAGKRPQQWVDWASTRGQAETNYLEPALRVETTRHTLT